MDAQPEPDRVADLIRWEDAGATWQVVGRTARGITIALLRCDGGEEVDRFTSNDPRLLQFVLRHNGIDPLVTQAQAAFGWADIVDVTAGPRGAVGQMWQVHADGTRYALKEIFNEPPTETSVDIEVDFARRAADVGIRVPACVPDRDGRYVLATPVGTWLRCYEWVDLHPVDLNSSDTPRRIGAMFAALHRSAPPIAEEPNGGGPPDPWYDTVPDPTAWADLVLGDAPWAARLRRSVDIFQAHSVTQADPSRTLLCHRDLHPENVFVDQSGALVAVDWDDFGPAEPGQELGRALFDWFYTDGETNLDAVRAMVDAYRADDGPGGVVDFTMLVAHRLNFLLSQARIALDPRSEPRRRAWAEQEVEMMLGLMPSAEQLGEVLAICR